MPKISKNKACIKSNKNIHTKIKLGIYLNSYNFDIINYKIFIIIFTNYQFYELIIKMTEYIKKIITLQKFMKIYIKIQKVCKFP